jgi:hypothetical protein
VAVAGAVGVDGEFGVTEAEADPEVSRLVEEPLRGRRRHLGLEPGLDLVSSSMYQRGKNVVRASSG